MARRWLLWLGAALLVALAGLLIVNGRGGGETQVERHIERVHALSDVAFARELGVLLGPPFLDGNQVTALLNGDQIFPAMLAAIRSAQTSITFETYIHRATSGAHSQRP
jgi:cardiolipin synthase